MATVTAFIRVASKKKDKVNVRFRLRDGRAVQLLYVSDLTVNPHHWNPKKEEIKAKTLIHHADKAEFNSPGELEVSTTTLSEVVVNCILHRSYAASAPLRIFIFDNRIEIHSPGLLPQGITVEDATHGVLSPRNELLFSNGIHLLPYTGAGSGLTRAKFYTPDIKFENDERLKESVVTIWRDDGVTYGGADGVRGEDKQHVDNVLDESGGDGIRNNGEDDGGVERIPYRLLTGQQKNIIQYCSIPRSAREILTHIGYKYHSDTVANVIRPLVAMTYLEYTIPEKPSLHPKYTQ